MDPNPWPHARLSFHPEECEAQSFRGTAGVKRRISVVEKCRRQHFGHCVLQALYANFIIHIRLNGWIVRRISRFIGSTIQRLTFALFTLYAAVSKRCKVAVQLRQDTLQAIR
jgi:hypothetical protein